MRKVVVQMHTCFFTRAERTPECSPTTFDSSTTASKSLPRERGLEGQRCFLFGERCVEVGRNVDWAGAIGKFQ